MVYSFAFPNHVVQHEDINLLFSTTASFIAFYTHSCSTITEMTIYIVPYTKYAHNYTGECMDFLYDQNMKLHCIVFTAEYVE